MTEYDNLKQLASPLIEKQMNISEEQKVAIIEYLKFRCGNESEISIDIGKNISIDCKEIERLNKENLTNFFVEKVFNAFYFEKYDCKLQECLEKQKFEYFLSSDFHENISKFSKYLLIATTIFGLLYFISIETIENKLLSFGTIFVLISIPYLLIDYMNLFFEEKLEQPEIFLEVTRGLKAHASFLLYFFVLGLVFLLIYALLLLRKRRLLRKNNKKYVAGKRRDE